MSDPNLKAIGDKTSVQLSVIIGTIGILIGAIWWASAINTKVDSLIAITSSYRVEQEVAKQKLADLETRVRILEQHKP